MRDDSYRVVVASATAELSERRSKFIAWIEPILSEEQTKIRLESVSTLRPGATHYCWAWRLGAPALERSSDAGEPAGTAGEPILRALRGAGVSDVAAVVARWYGGTRLGRGGLIRAYGGVTAEALERARITERWCYESFDVDLTYPQFNALQRLVQPPRIELADLRYGERVHGRLRVVPSRRSQLLERLAALAIEPSRS